MCPVHTVVGRPILAARPAFRPDQARRKRLKAEGLRYCEASHGTVSLNPLLLPADYADSRVVVARPLPATSYRFPCITSIGCRPATGTSNRRCFRDAFTSLSGRPFTSDAARRSIASVPSIASTATHARSLIATLWPISALASAFATRRP